MKIKWFFIFLICVVLAGCSKAFFEESISSQEDLVEGERLEAIFHNGECYYGLVMSKGIKSGEVPEDFTYLGTISSIIEGYRSPTEELSSTYGEVGDEIYHYIDEEGLHYFCIPDKKRKDYYYGIFIATTEKPEYYDQ